jgi:uncharacterized Zn-finger protein
MQEDKITVQERRIACSGNYGGSDSLGHPKVYLIIGSEDEATCPYCGKSFIYEPKEGQELRQKANNSNNRVISKLEPSLLTSKKASVTDE